MCRGEDNHRCDNAGPSKQMQHLFGFMENALAFKYDRLLEGYSIEVLRCTTFLREQGELHGRLWGSSVQISEDMLDNVDKRGASHMLLQ